MSKEILGAVKIFSRLPDTDLKVLAAITKEETHKKGDIIFTENAESDKLYIIKSGRIRVYKDLVSGDVKNLAILEPGEAFGEFSIFDELPRSASCIAYEDAVLATVSKADFNTLISNNAAVAVNILREVVKELSLRIRKTNEQLRDKIFWSFSSAEKM